ncbi:hypothetical protein FE257_004857 [Aspergillus nanangensis]|uniref:Cupin type-2 domain-containing protein n=1 Tax=Aspergillus nanangensis TaxID=2582783 RepID=A0AAD4CAN0_ASPNN|nr:hypothetical protein FE257_004857 [Aspergillus nanangensis]
MTDQTTSPLPNFTRYITTHNNAGQSIIHSQTTSSFHPFIQDQVFFYVPYTTSEFPPNLNHEHDVTEYAKTLARGDLGPVTPNGTVWRVVDIAPGMSGPPDPWLGSQSLDFAVVLEGEIELVLDSGERQRVHRGDLVVQRATRHKWWNPSKTEWTRMVQLNLPWISSGKLDIP